MFFTPHDLIILDKISYEKLFACSPVAGVRCCFPASSGTKITFKDTVWHLSNLVGLGLGQEHGSGEE